jgi:predicted acyltransferase
METGSIQPMSNRLISLDFLRGFTMVLLALESTGLYEHLFDLSKGSFSEPIFIQFFHHPWHGLRIWDLIQPMFMFLAGTAMAFSLTRQNENNVPWSDSFVKTLKRCGWLFFWGVLDYAVRPNGLSFELWDVLTQLSFTTLVAFLIFRWSFTSQIIFSLALLALTEILYRFSAIPGFDQPFTDQHNFGNYVDLLLMNKINRDGWVAINCIPTATHTIWGALAGKVLLSHETVSVKIKKLVVCGIVLLVLGYVLDFTMTPIIKRIATSSFTLASGGWCLLALAGVYWWVDGQNHKKFLTFFIVFGMNSVFIYLFFEIVGARWFNHYIGALSNGLMQAIHVPNPPMLVMTSMIIFSLEWGLCYFLYSKRIFFKL